jgi:hypothetical protein
MQRISEVSHRTLEGTSQARDLIGELSRSYAPFEGLLNGNTAAKTAASASGPLAALLAPRLASRMAWSEQRA